MRDAKWVTRGKRSWGWREEVTNVVCRLRSRRMLERWFYRSIAADAGSPVGYG